MKWIDVKYFILINLIIIYFSHLWVQRYNSSSLFLPYFLLHLSSLSFFSVFQHAQYSPLGHEWP